MRSPLRVLVVGGILCDIRVCRNGVLCMRDRWRVGVGSLVSDSRPLRAFLSRERFGSGKSKLTPVVIVRSHYLLQRKPRLFLSVS